MLYVLLLDNHDEGKDSSTELPLRRWVHLAFTFRNRTNEAGTAPVNGSSSWYTIVFHVDGVVDSHIAFNQLVSSNSGSLYIGKDPWMLGVRGA